MESTIYRTDRAEGKSELPVELRVEESVLEPGGIFIQVGDSEPAWLDSHQASQLMSRLRNFERQRQGRLPFTLEERLARIEATLGID